MLPSDLGAALFNELNRQFERPYSGLHRFCLARQRLTIRIAYTRKRDFAMCVISLGTCSRLFHNAAVVKYLAPDVSLSGLFYLEVN